MTRALLFDYGGTLDTSACHWYYVLRRAYLAAGLRYRDSVLRQAYVYGERALAQYPIIQPEDDFLMLLHKKIDQEFQWLEKEGYLHFDSESDLRANLPDTDGRLAKVHELATWCDAFARRHAERSAKVLSRLAARYTLVLVSNFYGNLRAVVDGYGLGQFFPTIIESSVVGVRKPDPEIWRLAVRAAGCAPQETLAIGDSFNKDVKAAHAAGCQTVWFKGREWKEASYDESLPTHIITQLPQLLTLLLPDA